MPEDDVPTSTENKSEMMKGRMENSEAHRIRRFTCSGCVKCVSCQSFMYDSPLRLILENYTKTGKAVETNENF